MPWNSLRAIAAIVKYTLGWKHLRLPPGRELALGSPICMEDESPSRNMREKKNAISEFTLVLSCT